MEPIEFATILFSLKVYSEQCTIYTIKQVPITKIKLYKKIEINVEAIARLPQVETNTDLDRPPSEEEVKKAIKQLSTGKAPDTDAIPAEVYKHGGDTLLQKLTDLFCRMWDEEVISQQLKDASIIHLYQKGNRQAMAVNGKVRLTKKMYCTGLPIT